LSGSFSGGFGKDVDKAKIVTSIRGPGGGFSFSRPLDALTVKEIVDTARNNGYNYDKHILGGT